MLTLHVYKKDEYASNKLNKVSKFTKLNIRRME
jgi:hypothetical protein